jgi:hypothetical protein
MTQGFDNYFASKFYHPGVALIGSTASTADFANAKVIASQGDSGLTSTNNIGLVGEGIASGAGATGYGIFGVSEANAADAAIGVYGRATVNAGADAAAAYGVQGISTTAHAGGSNVGVYGEASGGANNYSFYGAAGVAYNAGDINTVAWVDWSATATAAGLQAGYTKTVYYKKIGKMVFVNFTIAGTANGDQAYIALSLPYVPATGNQQGHHHCTSTRGATTSASYLIVVNADNIRCYADPAGTHWNGDAVGVYGTCWYEATT